MKEFIKKYLFGDFQQVLLQKEKDLILFERKLNELEIELNLQEETNDLNALSIRDDRRRLQEKENALKGTENVLNGRFEFLKEQENELDSKKRLHSDFILKQKDSIAKKRKELSEYEKNLKIEKKLLDAYLQEIESTKEENEKIRVRNEEIANYKIVNIRGKEALIDKYGNFKEFKK